MAVAIGAACPQLDLRGEPGEQPGDVTLADRREQRVDDRPAQLLAARAPRGCGYCSSQRSRGRGFSRGLRPHPGIPAGAAANSELPGLVIWAMPLVPLRVR